MANTRNAIKIPAKTATGIVKLAFPSETIPTSPVAKFATPGPRTRGGALSLLMLNI